MIVSILLTIVYMIGWIWSFHAMYEHDRSLPIEPLFWEKLFNLAMAVFWPITITLGVVWLLMILLKEWIKTLKEYLTRNERS